MDQTFVGLAVGFGLAAVLISVALFQETLAAVLRWFGGRGMNAVVTLSRRATTGSGSIVQVARRTVFGVARRTRRWIEDLARTAQQRRRAANSAAGVLVAQPLDSTDALVPTSSVELDPVTATVVSREQARENVVGDSRAYLPLSSVAVTEKARDYLVQRGGSASADALIQHLDGHFGPGRGFALVESLRRRGALELRRDPTTPTRINASLPAQGATGMGSGSISP